MLAPASLDVIGELSERLPLTLRKICTSGRKICPGKDKEEKKP